jgi:hypothetical protein
VEGLVENGEYMSTTDNGSLSRKTRRKFCAGISGVNADGADVLNLALFIE